MNPSTILIYVRRLQIQGEMKSGGSNVKYRGMIQTAIGIAREEVGFITIFHLLSLNVIDQNSC